jgi:hypothetical protein
MSLAVQGPLLSRLREMQRLGYLSVINGQFILTEKGWWAFLAIEDAPLQKDQLKAEPKP